MAGMLRVKLNWTGFVGAPGYTNLHFREIGGAAPTQANANSAITAVDTFLDGWVTYLPSTVNVLADPTVEVIEDTTGALTGFFATTPDTARVGTQAGTYSASSGAVVNWGTSTIRNGRRIRGRTFMLPLAGNAYDAAGSIDNTKLGAMRLLATNFISPFGTVSHGVWGRPTTPGGTDGVWAQTTTSTIPDMAAVLRSRRD